MSDDMGLEKKLACFLRGEILQDEDRKQRQEKKRSDRQETNAHA